MLRWLLGAFALLAVQVRAQSCPNGLALETDYSGLAGCCYPQALLQCDKTSLAFFQSSSGPFSGSKDCTYGPRALGNYIQFTAPSSLSYVPGIQLFGAPGEAGNFQNSSTAGGLGAQVRLGGTWLNNGGQVWKIYPASFGAALPTNTSGEGATWGRGGAASVVMIGNQQIWAAGGGGGGSAGPGGDAHVVGDTTGPYYTDQAGQAPTSDATTPPVAGGGGAGYLGGLAGNSALMTGGTGGQSYVGPTSNVNLNTVTSRTYYKSAPVVISFDCIAPTYYVTVPATTQTVQQTLVVTQSATTLPPAQVTETDYAETPAGTDTITATYQPPAASVTSTETDYTYPPQSTDVSWVTPPTSTFTETASVFSEGASTTLVDTYTPPVSSMTETDTSTVTPALFYSTSTSTPPTRTIVQTETATDTVSSGTFTAVVTSTRGSASCTQLRMTYPFACCPTRYMSGLKPVSTAPPTPASAARLRRRNRRSIRLQKRDTITVKSGTTTVTSTATSTSYLSTVTPAPQIIATVTVTTPGANATATSTETDAADTLTFSATTTLQGNASTTTLLSTADAPSTTETSTAFFDRSTLTLLAATSTVATSVQYLTLDTPTSVIHETAPTPLYTSTTTMHVQQTVPVATATTTTYAKPSSCAVNTVWAASCPVPFLQGLDQFAQTALIKVNKLLSGNQPVIIDCGSAGSFTY
ncbi:hypothetical protein NBRC10513v2_004842 [Rhodotorula toruloides]